MGVRVSSRRIAGVLKDRAGNPERDAATFARAPAPRLHRPLLLGHTWTNKSLPRRIARALSLIGSCIARLLIHVVEVTPAALMGIVQATQISNSFHNLFVAIEMMSACCHACSAICVGARGLLLLLLLFLPSPAPPGWL